MIRTLKQGCWAVFGLLAVSLILGGPVRAVEYDRLYALAYDDLKSPVPSASAEAGPSVAASPAEEQVQAADPGPNVRLSGSSGENDDYIMGPGDVVNISVWGQLVEIRQAESKIQEIPDLTVSADGKLLIPILGEIQAGGRTFRDVKQDILKNLAKYYHDIDVSVVLKAIPSFRIYVLGEVRTPSIYPVTAIPTFGNPNERRVFHFIAMAGGLTANADFRNIQVLRPDPQTGQNLVLTVDFFKLTQENDLSQNIQIQKGDTIIVPQKITSVYVLGEVSRPGAFGYVADAKLIDYVTWAGGVKDTAAASNIGIIRGQGDQAKVITTSLNDILKWGRPGPLQQIEPNDIIFVPKNFIANWNDILGMLRLAQSSLDTPRNLRNSYYELQKALQSTP